MNIDELKRRVVALNALLEKPAPDNPSWCISLAQTLDGLGAWWLNQLEGDQLETIVQEQSRKVGWPIIKITGDEFRVEQEVADLLQVVSEERDDYRNEIERGKLPLN